MEDRIIETLKKYWGYDSFRPFQKDSILSILDSKDTLTILPTGGGKSVCFQLPSLITEGLAVIISPLISLMKDQVDFLKDLGIAAECLNSSLNYKKQQEVAGKIISGRLKLLYISPERLNQPSLMEMLKPLKISFFVIDEAHCISHWGHDFRADYRTLGMIKKEFPGINIHAFTATATPEVQKDIIEQLKLEAPHIYIGSVDRPNLTYRVLPRTGNVIDHILKVIRKNENEPGIIYCLRRKDVDLVSEELNKKGYRNLPYHAGLSDSVRKKNQDEFSSENIPIIVATIAFGMGIDRSNIRYIIHAAMPKSVEHYQQETGRAGRDGLPAECYMFYSYRDYKTWEFLLKETGQRESMLKKLKVLYDYCSIPRCRHKYLLNYFGEGNSISNCGACDLCLGEVEMVPEALIIAQKILSCVLRVKERFGAEHISNVLKGTANEKVTQYGHDKLSTFGLMSNETKAYVRYMTEQLIGQGFLKSSDEFSVLSVTETGRSLLKGEIVPSLAKPLAGRAKKEVEKKRRIKRIQDWTGVDKGLFELLRAKRAELARTKDVPAYIIFGDKSLREMAALKPVTKEQLSRVYGIGETKLAQYGEIFIKLIREYKTG